MTKRTITDVVRAVAGLFQYLQVLSSSGKDGFEEEYKKALRLPPKIRDRLVGKRNGNEGR